MRCPILTERYLETSTTLRIRNLDTDKGSREKFRRNIQKDATYGAGYFMEGQQCNFVW